MHHQKYYATVIKTCLAPNNKQFSQTKFLGLVPIKFFQCIILQKLIGINGLISINFCSQSERPRKRYNSTTDCCYLSN